MVDTSSIGTSGSGSCGTSRIGSIYSSGTVGSGSILHVEVRLVADPSGGGYNW
jgi:hypothetical protein